MPWQNNLEKVQVIMIVMPKRIASLTLFLALVITACAQSSQVAAPVVSPTPTQPSGHVTAQVEITRPPGCTMRTRKATSDPTQQSLLPLPSETDWAKGPDDAYVTIIEYSDFQ